MAKLKRLIPKHSRKGNTKGTNYRPGRPAKVINEVPAIEESLPNPDEGLA